MATPGLSFINGMTAGVLLSIAVVLTLPRSVAVQPKEKQVQPIVTKVYFTKATKNTFVFSKDPMDATSPLRSDIYVEKSAFHAGTSVHALELTFTQVTK